MAYYYSNQQQNLYHYLPNQSYQTNFNYDYYYTNNHPTSYTQYYNTNPFYTTYENYYYDTTNPTQSTTNIVNDDHVSAEIATFHAVDNSKEDDEEEEDEDEEDMEENHKKHFHGGYNMSETYGKPLPPSNEICYPPSKVELSSTDNMGSFSYDSIASPYGKNDQKHAENEPKRVNEVVVSEPIKEEEQEQSSKDNNDSGSDDGNEIMVKRQIPPGYGIEALDLCEGVFGGYFPCLWKRKETDQRSNGNKISYYNDEGENNYWKETADYLFGNPNPYGGSMLEKGSYGDPIYCYHKYFPQQLVCQQVEIGNYSWLHNSTYDYE